MQAEEPIFRCGRCGEDRPIEELPRVSLAVTTGSTAHLWSQLMCVRCLRSLLWYLHHNYCPQDVDGYPICGEEHGYEL